ncbi:MAG: hypothetical protein WCL14_01370 [Bacteroidota bacterium]
MAAAKRQSLFAAANHAVKDLQSAVKDLQSFTTSLWIFNPTNKVTAVKKSNYTL